MKFQYLKGPIISFVFLIHIPLLAQNLSPNDFVTTWKTNNPGDSNNNPMLIGTMTEYLMNLELREV